MGLDFLFAQTANTMSNLSKTHNLNYIMETQSKNNDLALAGYSLRELAELLSRFTTPVGKKSFLVFKNHKYFNVLTENIAFFYVKYESPVIMCFNKEEYFVNYSLDHVQQLLPEKQFFRLNRQYLINFHAVKEVEHYFARKLLVNPVVPIKDKLLVPKERVSGFLHWLDDR
jgi:two-component system, LytTR family, response regulator LytT